MRDPLNIGVVGCGYWGPNLIRNFHSLGDAHVKMACDADTKRLAHMQSLYPGVEVTTDFETMVNNDEIDAIAIATPVSTHYELAKKSLLAGKHVFIEKPMAASSFQCEDLVDIAKNNNRTLMVGHTFVYTAAVRKIKQIIDSGEIGDVLYISSRRLNLGLFQKDINVVWDLAPHDLSIILYLMKDEPDFINCQGKAHFVPGIEDVATLSLQFPNGRFATINSSWLDPQKIREMKIVGTKKMIVYDDIEPMEKIKLYDKSVQVPDHYDTYAEFHYAYHYGDVYSPYIKQVEPLKIECQHFVDCINNNEIPESCGEKGLQVVKILEAANSSLEKNGSAIALTSTDECVKPDLMNVLS